MGKGSGSGTNTVTSTTTELPEYAQPYYTSLLERTGYQTAQPYDTYTGARIADQTPTQNAANEAMMNMATSGQGEGLTEAQRLSYNVGNDSFGDVNTSIFSGYMPNQAGTAGSYDANAMQRQEEFIPGRLDDSGMLNNYMSPYMQNVVDVEKREARRQGDITNQNIGSAAAQQGGLGGYRDAIMRSENNRNTGQLMGDLQTQGQQAAFADAKQSYEQDRAARAADEQFKQSQFDMNMGSQQFGSQASLQQYQTYELARQQAAALGMSAQEANQAGQLALQQNQLSYQQNQLQAANQLAGYDQQSWQSALERIGIVSGVGAGEQEAYQKSLDTGYNDWLRQQSYPYEQLNFLSNMLQGTGMAPGTTQSIFGPQASSTQQLLGSGIASAGLFDGKGG